MGQFSVITGTDVSLTDNIATEIGNRFSIAISGEEINLRTKSDNETTKLANILTKVIVDEYENKILLKLIEQNYCYFTKPEKRRIYKIALKYLISDEDMMHSYMQKRRYDMICDKLSEYMNSSSSIVIDGFVNFRLKEYEGELQEIITKAVDDFVIEREYNEFIAVLKYFTQLQEPKYVTMHILPHSNGQYSFFDEKKVDITDVCTQQFSVEDDDLILKSDDLLLSILISTSPSKIIFHKSDTVKNREIVKTINAVFGKRIVKCDKCDVCK